MKSQKKCGAVDEPKEDVMIEKTVVVSMMGEAEERPVAVLVQIASQYDSKVHLVTGDKRINAKSIMGMMSMNFENGSELTIVADGADEEAAVNALSEYLTKTISNLDDLLHLGCVCGKINLSMDICRRNRIWDF